MEQNENTQEIQVKIEVIQGGPYIVSGKINIVDKAGIETFKEGKSALCRCGGSKNKPFCDGSHKEIEFDK
jgi:CDGSH-type Zn-finger protein